MGTNTREEREEIVLRSGRFDHVKVGTARKLIDGTADLSRAPVTRSFYFGCIDNSGHYLWDKNRGKTRQQTGKENPIPWNNPDGELQPIQRGQTGAALIHYKREEGGPIWTAIGFWDSTVDKRPGSNSAFFFDSHLNFDEAVAEAQKHFPEIFERLPFELYEAEA